MRLLKDRIQKEVSNSEIIALAYDPTKKVIASNAFEEPVLIFRYPYLKVIKKIIHREKLPILEPPVQTLQTLQAKFNAPSSEEDQSGEMDSTEGEQGNNLERPIDLTKGNIISATKLLFTSDGKHLFIGYANGDLLVFNTVNWKKEQEYNFLDKITALQLVDHQSKVFLTTSNWNISLIELPSYNILQTKQIDTIGDGSALITDDLRIVYLISDKKRVRSLDFETLQELHTFKGHKSGINMIRLSPDGKMLATCGNDSKICLFNAQTGELNSYLIGHSDEVHSCEFSPLGDFLVSSSEDDTIKLWDTTTFKCVKIISGVSNAFCMIHSEDLLILGNVAGDIATYKLY